MKKSIVILTLMVSLVFVAGVFALDVSNPQDALVRSTDAGANFDGPDLAAVSTFLASCGVSDITYLKWNITGPIDASASLALTADAPIGANTGQLTLYRVADDSWDETTITYNNRPALGAEIMNLNPVPAAPGPVNFSGPALVTYLNEEAAGDGVVSFALQVDGCTQFGPNGIRMDSKEDTAGTAPSLSTTTAVTLQSFRPDNNGISPIVWVGLLLVVVLAFGAFVTLRRRNTAA